MHPSRNLFRGDDKGGPEEPIYAPHRGATSLGFYRTITSTGGPRPYTAAIDNTPENERILVIGNASQSPNPPWNSSEDLSRTKPNTETKTRKFPKLKFSLTAPPLKPKAKQPGKVPPPVRVGGRGGAGNIKKFVPDKSVATASPDSSEIPKSNAVPTPIANLGAPQSPPEGETTDPNYGPSSLSPEGREVAIPRMKPATSGRGGAGNLHHHVLEEGVFKRVIAHEDTLIRQRRDMQADKLTHRTGRGGVGNIKRPDGDSNEGRSASRSGSSRSRGFIGRVASTSTRSSGTTSSSVMSVDIPPSVTDTAANPNFQQPTPLPDDAHEPLSSFLEQGGADVLVESDNDAHLGKVRSSPRRTNASYAIPPGATTRNTRSDESLRRFGPRSRSPPRLYLPLDHQLDSPQNRYHEGRRFVVTNPDNLESKAASRPQDAPALDGLSGQYYSRSSRMTPSNEVPHSSSSRYPQNSIHTTPFQHGLEESVVHQFGVKGSPEDLAGHTQAAHRGYQGTYATPTVSPPTPSTVSVVDPSIWSSRRTAGSMHYAVDRLHLKSRPKELDEDRVPEFGADEDYTADLEVAIKSQEENLGSLFSDLFGRRMAMHLETDSTNSSGAETPLSDKSSILIPRQSLLNALSSVAKQREMPTDPQFAGIPLVPPAKPTWRPRPQSGEGPLHCDERNLPPNKPLSRVEKAILRRVEFGPNVDFSRVQLS